MPFSVLVYRRLILDMAVYMYLAVLSRAAISLELTALGTLRYRWQC